MLGHSWQSHPQVQRAKRGTEEHRKQHLGKTRCSWNSIISSRWCHQVLRSVALWKQRRVKGRKKFCRSHRVRTPLKRKSNCIINMWTVYLSLMPTDQIYSSCNPRATCHRRNREMKRFSRVRAQVRSLRELPASVTEPRVVAKEVVARVSWKGCSRLRVCHIWCKKQQLTKPIL